ncbi:putative secreted protein [Sphaerotilus hippei]|uniref:Putative secreted protein n=1 Tax=Sphaerotilus hippei TaxID=744406 RepID=A0A318HEA2_9BURK|nr:SIMPL domain-containing protein [Sphaerotilus hippei]PXW98043.1 putative secreted protein [Sphaerotilus hippei]
MNTRRSNGARAVVTAMLGAGLLLAAPWGRAADPGASAPREQVVNLGASSTIEVEPDVLMVTLQAVRDGTEAAAVQSQLKQVLGAALDEARRQAAAGRMEVSTGTFQLSPRYGKDGRISGWVGQAELLLQGSDGERVAATAGRLAGLNVVSTGYGLSRELRERHERQLTAQAVARFRTRAGEVAKAFGATNYELREVSVDSGGEQPGRPMVVMAMRAKGAAAEAAPMPTEAGRMTLSATVQGSVRLLP